MKYLFTPTFTLIHNPMNAKWTEWCTHGIHNKLESKSMMPPDRSKDWPKLGHFFQYKNQQTSRDCPGIGSAWYRFCHSTPQILTLLSQKEFGNVWSKQIKSSKAETCLAYTELFYLWGSQIHFRDLQSHGWAGRLWPLWNPWSQRRCYTGGVTFSGDSSQSFYINHQPIYKVYHLPHLSIFIKYSLTVMTLIFRHHSDGLLEVFLGF